MEEQFDFFRGEAQKVNGMNRNNVMGAFISGLAAERRIRFTGRTVKSSAVSRHTGTQREWVKVR